MIGRRRLLKSLGLGAIAAAVGRGTAQIPTGLISRGKVPDVAPMLKPGHRFEGPTYSYTIVDEVNEAPSLDVIRLVSRDRIYPGDYLSAGPDGYVRPASAWGGETIVGVAMHSSVSDVAGEHFVDMAAIPTYAQWAPGFKRLSP